ncbi:MAG TPA: ATP-binding cassette domain-containing protein [Thermoanaerobaculia bacterium]|jgi:ABC-2 type transport system ATP-binding protein|nr:ATP-binding cassette domain-containing protein [Thermoanaerobaculia bacterium]
MAASLELRNVEKRYGDFVAVARLSLAVPAGVIFGLLGPNGAGKTTTLRMIMDILAPDAGEVLLFGRPRRPADLRRIGYLPEERGLYRKMTVIDQLLFLAEIHGMKRRQALPAVEEWLARVELADWGQKKVEELSKGMQQKVQLIGTVLHQPEILILDEPFSGLDPINQGLFKDLLLEYRRLGRTILFSTHGMAQAEKLCDHIGLISRGRLVLDGELKEIKRQASGNAYRLVAPIAPADLERVKALPGIEAVLPRDDGARLLLAVGASGPQLLRRLVEFLEVSEFRSEEPDLEDIFIKAVGDAA